VRSFISGRRGRRTTSKRSKGKVIELTEPVSPWKKGGKGEGKEGTSTGPRGILGRRRHRGFIRRIRGSLKGRETVAAQFLIVSGQRIC